VSSRKERFPSRLPPVEPRRQEQVRERTQQQRERERAVERVGSEHGERLDDAEDEGVAGAYGREIIRLTVISFGFLAVIVVVFARPIAGLFTTDPETIELTVPFVRIGAVAAIALGIDRTTTGALRGAGDTRWPFYGSLVGLYAFALPVAYLGVVTSLGMMALYLALLVETAVPALITYYRYRMGEWQAISRSIRRAG
jgi:Na+-driven multidrug efflux pump